MNIDYPATLLRIRAELNLSQTELAEILNVSYTSVNRWENAKYQPTKVAREKIIVICEEKNIAIMEN